MPFGLYSSSTDHYVRLGGREGLAGAAKQNMKSFNLADD